MSLLLLFNQDTSFNNEEFLSIPAFSGVFEFNDINRNGFVKFVDDFSINFNLLNRGVMTCKVIDPREDLANAWRPQTNDRVVVRTEVGMAAIFSGRILRTRETSLQPNQRTGTALLVDIVDDLEVFDYVYWTGNLGSDKTEIGTVNSGNPSAIVTNTPHGLITGTTVTIEGVGGVGAAVNGTWTATVVNENTFTVPVNVVTGGSGLGGTVRGRVYLRDAVDAIFTATGLNTLHGIIRDSAMDLGPLLEFYRFDTKLSEIFATIFGAANWIHRLLPTKIFQAFPPGEKVADELTFDEVSCFGSPQTEKSRSGFAHTVRIPSGSHAIVDKVDIFPGNGSQSTWPLTYRFGLNTDGTVPGLVNGAVVAPYSAVNTTHEWMYQATTNELVHNSSFGPFPAGAVATFSYKVQFPQVTEVKDDTLITAMGGVIWTKRLDLPDVYEINSAKEQGEVELANIKVQPRLVSFSSRKALVLPGTTVPTSFASRLITNSTDWMVTSTTITEDKDGAFVYRYTVQEDNRFKPGWIDFFKNMARGSNSGVVPTSSTIPQSSSTGGVGGIGTAGKFAKWATTNTLTDAANLEEIVGGVKVTGFIRGTIGGSYDLQVQNNGGGVVMRNPTGSTTAEFPGTIKTPQITSIAGDLLVGAVGSVKFNPTSKILLPNLPYDINIGMLSQKFLTLHAAELWVETLVAQNTMATIGGRILVAPTNSLIADLSTSATTIDVKYNNFANGDRVYMEADGKVEFFGITSAATSITGGYRYSVNRNLDTTGANDWFAGDALVNTGQTGSGFIDLYSVRGTRAATEIGPTIVGNVRNSATYNDWSPRWAIGNLNGLYGYGSNIYGAAFGVPSAAWIKIDPTNGVRIGHNATTFAQITASGSASFTGSVTVVGSTNVALQDMSNVTTIDGGKITTNSITASKINVTSLSAIQANIGNLVINSGGNIISSGMGWGSGGPGVYLGWNGSAHVFAVGNWGGQRVFWDGTNLNVFAGNIEISPNGIVMGTGTASSGSRIWIGGAILNASLSGRLEVNGGLLVTGNGSVTDWAVFGNNTVSGSLTVAGMVSPTNGMDINGNIHWTNPATTDSADQPLVRSPSNGNIYVKTNGVSVTINVPSTTNIVVQNGIITGVS